MFGLFSQCYQLLTNYLIRQELEKARWEKNKKRRADIWTQRRHAYPDVTVSPPLSPDEDEDEEEEESLINRQRRLTAERNLPPKVLYAKRQRIQMRLRDKDPYPARAYLPESAFTASVVQAPLHLCEGREWSEVLATLAVEKAHREEEEGEGKWVFGQLCGEPRVTG